MIKEFLNDCENSNIERVLFACFGRRLVEYELCNAVNFNTGMHVHKACTLNGPRPCSTPYFLHSHSWTLKTVKSNVYVFREDNATQDSRKRSYLHCRQ